MKADEDRAFWLRTLRRKVVLAKPIKNKTVLFLIDEGLAHEAGEGLWRFNGEVHKGIYVELTDKGRKLVGKEKVNE